jgi:hypothetical protein
MIALFAKMMSSKEGFYRQILPFFIIKTYPGLTDQQHCWKICENITSNIEPTLTSDVLDSLSASEIELSTRDVGKMNSIECYQLAEEYLKIMEEGESEQQPLENIKQVCFWYAKGFLLGNNQCLYKLSKLLTEMCEEEKDLVDLFRRVSADIGVPAAEVSYALNP